MSEIIKYSISLSGHSTSLTLETLFLETLRQISRELHKPLTALIAEIDAQRLQKGVISNLSSAVRCFVLTYYLQKTADLLEEKALNGLKDV